MRVSSLALANLLLAAAIIMVGWPSIRADFRRVPAEVTISAVQSGSTISEEELKQVLPALESAATTSTAAREDLAFTLLANIAGAPETERVKRAAQATEELRAYLAETPGDARGWAALGRTELMQNHRVAAREALKLSVLTSPWSPELVLWRCGLGVDLYGDLDDEARELVQEQFRVAAERDPHSLARLMRQKNAVLIAQVMLARSPEGLLRFNEGLVR